MACRALSSAALRTPDAAVSAALLSPAPADDRSESLTTWKKTVHRQVLLPPSKARKHDGQGRFRAADGCHVAVKCMAEESADALPRRAPSRRQVINILIASSAAAAASSSWGLPSQTQEPSGANGFFLSTAMAAEEVAEPTGLRVYFGNAAAAASYGGYGGNANKQSEAEYTYKVPAAWKEHVVSKIEKGTNGTDSEFYNPKKRTEKVYLTYLAGVPKLGPKDAILNNLALSDVSLQDALAEAEEIVTAERTDADGQLYYDYELSSGGDHRLITVTCKRNKLYALFVRSPEAEFKRDESMLREIWGSFSTV